LQRSDTPADRILQRSGAEGKKERRTKILEEPGAKKKVGPGGSEGAAESTKTEQCRPGVKRI